MCYNSTYMGLYTLNLFFDAPPFSINKAHYRNGQRTTACRKWGDKLLKDLSVREDDVIEFRNKFNLQKHCLTITILHLLPKSKLFTLEGRISLTSNDLSNIEKMLIDILFDKRFDDRGNTNVCLNDALLVDMKSYKRESPDNEYHIFASIEIEDMNLARNLDIINIPFKDLKKLLKTKIKNSN